MNRFDLTGKRALVTGGRRGIGLAIANALCEHGAEVTVTGVGEGPALVSDMAFRQLDIRDAASVAALARDTDALDILVNNAGVLARAGKEYEPDTFADIIGTNLIGTYRMCHAFRPLLAESQGCIINLLTIRAFISSPLTPAYGASKAALLQLTRTLGREWGPGIRGQRHRTGLDAHRHERLGAAGSGGERRDRGRGRAEAVGNAGRHRGRRRLPGLAGGVLRHRHLPVGRWRIHRIRPPSPPPS